MHTFWEHHRTGGVILLDGRAKADGSVARTVTRICRRDLIVDLSGVPGQPSVTLASVA